MRKIMRLLNDTFGIRYYLIIPVAIFVIIYMVFGGETELPKVISPANTGAMTMLLMLGLGSNNGSMTLLKLLPTKSGKVTAALQLSLYLMLLMINSPYLVLSFVLEKLSPSGITLQYTAVLLLLNVLFMITFFNLLLPLMLLKGLKPLKVTAVCISLMIPFLLGDMASIMAEKLEGSTWTAIVLFGVIALLTSFACFHFSKRRIQAYEA